MMTKVLASYVLVVLILALAPTALKGGPLCPRQNATLQGTHMSHGTGTVVGVGPVAAVGTITYDGQGNLVNPFTLSVNGSVSTFTQTGTYNVNSDCTGTVVQAGAHYHFVVAPDGSAAFWIETDAGTILSGTAVRMNPVQRGEDAQVHPSKGLPGPTSHRVVTLQPAKFRSRTGTGSGPQVAKSSVAY